MVVVGWFDRYSRSGNLLYAIDAYKRLGAFHFELLLAVARIGDAVF